MENIWWGRLEPMDPEHGGPFMAVIEKGDKKAAILEERLRLIKVIFKEIWRADIGRIDTRTRESAEKLAKRKGANVLITDPAPTFEGRGHLEGYYLLYHASGEDLQVGIKEYTKPMEECYYSLRKIDHRGY